MIQAENSTQIPQTKQLPTENIDVKVHGFSTPAGKTLETNRTTDGVASGSATNTPSYQEIHPHRNRSILERFFHWWHKIAVILLTAHGLVGIWESIKFIAVDFKELERQLELHEIQTEDVNHLVSKAIIVAATTLVNIFMAVRLSKTKETTAHNIDLIIATILIIGTRLIQEILIQFDLLNIIINLF